MSDAASIRSRTLLLDRDRYTMVDNPPSQAVQTGS